jgi:hypothetical protein
MWVTTHWASGAIDFLYTVKDAVEWGMSDLHLEYKAGHFSGYPVVAD